MTRNIARRLSAAPLLAALSFLVVAGPGAPSAGAAYLTEPEFTKGSSNTTSYQHV